MWSSYCSSYLSPMIYYIHTKYNIILNKIHIIVNEHERKLIDDFNIYFIIYFLLSEHNVDWLVFIFKTN